MSALLLAASATVAVATPAAAQRTAGIVLKGGMSYGGVSNGGVFPGQSGSRNGLAIGLGLITSKPVGLGIEGLYAQRGIVGSPGNSRRLDYIDVPVYLRVGARTPVLQPFAYAGPQVSFELKCDSDGGACPSGRDNLSYSGTIGAGLRFPRIAGLSVEGRYVYGLSDLKLGTVTDNESYRTRSFMLLFGFGF